MMDGRREKETLEDGADGLKSPSSVGKGRGEEPVVSSQVALPSLAPERH